MKLTSNTFLPLTAGLFAAWLLSTATTLAAGVLYAYDSLNRLTNVDYGNGSVIRYTYDSAGNRLTYSGAVGNDTTPPSIAVSNPASGPNFATTNSVVNLSGTSSDNVGVTLVTWANDRGGIGRAVGTTNWSISAIPLQAGANVISVTAYDGGGNSAIATLTVVLSAPTVGVSGGLAFANVTVGQVSTLTLIITNSGGLALNVSGISYPPGFSGAWSGTVAAGGFQQVAVTFAPTAAQAYGGTITVNCDSNGGTNKISCSGTGVNEVNVAPVLPLIATQTVNELALLTVTNTATDSNIHSILGYALLNPPPGMAIDANGIITWTPRQDQSPSTNFVTTVVTNSDPYDLVNPHLSATNNFTVIVNEVNVAPVLPAIATQTVNELARLTVTNTATESNIHATLGYSLLNPPAGMAIDTNGIITWTPQQNQSPSTNLVTTLVTNSNPYDLLNPHLSATNAFAVIVNEVNVTPVLPVIATQTVKELALLTVTNTSTESNIHSTLGYTLLNPPAGMAIDTNGIITWTPQQNQSPSTNLVTTLVTNSNPYDLLNPHLAATNTFTVIVNEVNVAPVLPVIATQTVNELALLTVTNTATESNIHSTLGYALLNPPAGMAIDTNGIITWTPQQNQSPSTNLITTIATNSNPYDFINPHLSATNAFTVIVAEVPLPQLGIVLIGGQPHLTWSAVPGWRYQVWVEEALANAAWAGVGGVLTASGDTLEFTDSATSGTNARFYRIEVLGAP
jgi:YD repeat-containing protein